MIVSDHNKVVAESRWPGGWLKVVPTKTMRQIAEDVASRHGLTPAELRIRTQAPRICHPRQEAMALMHSEGFSHTQIVRFFAFKDHTTSICACRSVARRALTQQEAA